MNFLSYTVVEISLTKNVERKKKKQENPGLNHRMQQVIYIQKISRAA